MAQWDLYRIHTQSGIANHKLAYGIWAAKGQADEIIYFYLEAKKRLSQAMSIDAETYIPTYWQARTIGALERFHQAMSPEVPNPYNAGEMYEKAIRLRPNDIGVHHAYSRYLAYIKNTDKLAEIVQNMARIYPPFSPQFKKEKYFSDDLIPSIENGLLSALSEEITIRQTHQALSSLYHEKKDYFKAINHYRKSLEFRSNANTWGSYIQMGRLYLESGDFEQSIPWFTKGLKKVPNFETAFKICFQIHKKDGTLKAFIRLCDHLSQTLIHPLAKIDIYVARAWMEMDEYSIAKSHLLRLNDVTPMAEAYYLLAKIAQKEKNWEQMEILAQKATTFDRKESSYYYLFSIALFRQRKYDHAEEIATKTIKYDTKNNPCFFNHRGWTRWAQKKYLEAVSDWNNAFVLKPTNSDLPYQMARAYEREGMFEEGLLQIQKAIALAPLSKKEKYMKFQKRLRLR